MASIIEGKSNNAIYQVKEEITVYKNTSSTLIINGIRITFDSDIQEYRITYPNVVVITHTGYIFINAFTGKYIHYPNYDVTKSSLMITDPFDRTVGSHNICVTQGSYIFVCAMNDSSVRVGGTAIEAYTLSEYFDNVILTEKYLIVTYAASRIACIHVRKPIMKYIYSHTHRILTRDFSDNTVLYVDDTVKHSLNCDMLLRDDGHGSFNEICINHDPVRNVYTLTYKTFNDTTKTAILPNEPKVSCTRGQKIKIYKKIIEKCEEKIKRCKAKINLIEDDELETKSDSDDISS